MKDIVTLTARVRQPLSEYERERLNERNRIQRLRVAGYTHTRCSCCGEIRPLRWAREGCNNHDYSQPFLPVMSRCTGLYEALSGQTVCRTCGTTRHGDWLVGSRCETETQTDGMPQMCAGVYQPVDLNEMVGEGHD